MSKLIWNALPFFGEKLRFLFTLWTESAKVFRWPKMQVQKINCLCWPSLLVWMPRGTLLINYTVNEWFHMLMPFSIIVLQMKPQQHPAVLLGCLHCLRIAAEIWLIPLSCHLRRVSFEKDPDWPLSPAASGRCTVLLLNTIISRWIHTNLTEHLKKTETGP